MTNHEYHYETSPWIKLDLNWDMLTEGYQAKRYSKGQVFYVEEETCPNVFIIKRGRVALHINSREGRMKTIITLDRGCMFGNLSLFDTQNNSCGAILVSDHGEIFTIPKRVVLEKMQSDPQISSNILIQNTREIRSLTKQIELLSFRSSEAIVCFYLLNIAKQYYDIEEGEGGVRTHIRMRTTHQDIADVTGLSRVSVSLVMSDLIKQNILVKKSGYYTIMDLEALEKKIEK